MQIDGKPQTPSSPPACTSLDELIARTHGSDLQSRNGPLVAACVGLPGM